MSGSLLLLLLVEREAVNITVEGVGGCYCWASERLLLLFLGKREVITDSAGGGGRLLL